MRYSAKVMYTEKEFDQIDDNLLDFNKYEKFDDLSKDAWHTLNNVSYLDSIRTKTAEEVSTFWEENTKYLLPNTCAYIFDIPSNSFVEATGFERIGLESISNTGFNKNPRSIKFLKKIIAEQRMMYAYEVRRVIAEIFNSYFDYFQQYEDLNYSAHITMIDFEDRRWHVQNIIKPLVYARGCVYLDDINDVKRNCLVQYFGTLSFVNQTQCIPFQSAILHKHDFHTKGQKKEILLDIKLELTKKIDKIKNDISTYFGFEEREVLLAHLTSDGYTAKEILEDKLYKLNSPKKNIITQGNLNAVRQNAAKKIRANFPEFVEHTEKKILENESLVEKLKKPLKKTVYELSPMHVHRFFKETRFDVIMHEDKDNKEENKKDDLD